MKFRTTRNTAMALAVAVFLIVFAAGCSHNDSDKSNLSTGIQQQSQQLQDIAARSGGDWNKLTPADKQVLVQQIAHGNEHNARMLLMASTPGGLKIGPLGRKGPIKPTNGPAN